jgi:Protein of unknown function (DUF2851)
MMLFKDEAEMARLWASDAVMGMSLSTRDGLAVRVVYAGRPGGSVGPDFRDAIFFIDGKRLAGDIELHLRASDWYAHGHDTDPHYNNVIAHIVAHSSPDAVPTRLVSGVTVPIIFLDEQSIGLSSSPITWPCKCNPMRKSEAFPVLRSAGQARFAARVARFRSELMVKGASLDSVLWYALAEAIGYGRDPALTRFIGQAIYRGAHPDIVGLDRISMTRLHYITRLVEGWRETSLAAMCCGTLLAGGVACGWQRLIVLLTSVETARGWGLGAGRAAIIAWNALLPCLAAYGDICGSRALARIACSVAESAPGIPSNAITRYMTRWFGWRSMPPGALAQQGLHHVYASWCRTKSCEGCPIGCR